MRNPSEVAKPRIVSLIVLSIAGLVYGVYMLAEIVLFVAIASETEGQIVSRNGSTFVIQYRVEGQTFMITEALPSTRGMSGLNRAALQPGTVVPVLYDPSEPGDARWNASRNWFFPICVIAVSLPCGFLGFWPNRAKNPFGS